MLDGYSLKPIEVAKALCESGCYEEALPYFDKVLELNPQDIEANYEKGYSLFKLGYYDKALSYFNNLIYSDFQATGEYYNTAAVYRKVETLEKLGRYDEALCCLIQQDPEAYLYNIVNYLEKNFIIKLTLRSYGVSSEDIYIISLALEGNSSLKELDLSDNNIDTEGAYVIAAVLKKNKSLESLNLNENYIEDNGVIRIAESLKQNNSLIRLNLGTNMISIKSIVNIFMILEENNNLKELDLSDNSIDTEGAYVIAAALEKNNSLIYLDLSNNNFDFNGTNIILKAWKNSYTIKEVRGLGTEYIDINGLTQEFKSQENKIQKYQIAKIINALQYNEDSTILKAYIINYENDAKYLFQTIANRSNIIYEKDSMMNKIFKNNTTILEQNIFKMISDFAGDTAITTFRLAIGSIFINEDRSNNTNSYKKRDIETLVRKEYCLLVKKQHIDNHGIPLDLMGLSSSLDTEEDIIL